MGNPAQSRRLTVERLGREGQVARIQGMLAEADANRWSASYRRELRWALAEAERVQNAAEIRDQLA